MEIKLTCKKCGKVKVGPQRQIHYCCRQEMKREPIEKLDSNDCKCGHRKLDHTEAGCWAPKKNKQVCSCKGFKVPRI